MGLRPFVTTGIALASTGALIAAMPAITPPATPSEATVAAAVPHSVYADVALRQSTQDLFNAFFSGYPDTNGPAGAVGLALLFSDEAFGEGSLPSTFVTGGIVGLATALSAGNPLLEAFFAGGPNDTPGGIVGVLDLLTENDALANAFVTGGIVGLAAALSAGNPLLEAFFAGGPNDTPGGIVGVADLLTQDNELANAFVTGGIVGVADVLTQDNELANTFVNEGFVGASELVLVNATAGDPVVSQGIQSFFSGYPFEVEDDPATPNVDESLPAGPAGIVGLTHYVLDRLAGNPTTPDPPLAPVMAELNVEQFSVQDDAARTGLPEANEPPSNGPAIQLRWTPPAPPTPPAVGDVVDDGASVVDSAAQALGNLAPAPPAAAPPAPAPEQKPVVTEQDGDVKKVTQEEMKSGNKAELPLILFQNRGGGGGSAWETESLPRWRDAFNRLGIGGDPAPSAPDAEAGGETGAEN